MSTQTDPADGFPEMIDDQAWEALSEDERVEYMHSTLTEIEQYLDAALAALTESG